MRREWDTSDSQNGVPVGLNGVRAEGNAVAVGENALLMRAHSVRTHEKGILTFAHGERAYPNVERIGADGTHRYALELLPGAYGVRGRGSPFPVCRDGILARGFGVRGACENCCCRGRGCRV